MIFVVGCARSGTSLTTKILQAHGCYLGPTVNGLFENTEIRDRIVKPYLTSIGADPLGQYPLAKDLKAFPGLRQRVLKAMGKPDEPWAYKCAKLAMIWPIWKEAFPEAKYVLVRREKEKIVDSCERCRFMTRAKDWRKWVEAHEEKFEEMRRNLDLVEVWTDNVVNDPGAFSPVARFCELPFNLEATRKAINRDVWH